MFNILLSQVPRRQVDWNYRPIELGDVVDIAENFSTFLITIGPVIIAIALIWSGLVYMYAGSDTTKVTLAKTIFKNGLIGGLIIFGIGTILATLEALGLDVFRFFSF